MIGVDDRPRRTGGVKGEVESWRNPDKEENKEKMNGRMEKGRWGSGREAPCRQRGGKNQVNSSGKTKVFEGTEDKEANPLGEG